jgi:hypothetical protein
MRDTTVHFQISASRGMSTYGRGETDVAIEQDHPRNLSGLSSATGRALREA